MSDQGLSVKFIRGFDTKGVTLIGGGTSENFPERLEEALESCKRTPHCVILDRTVKASKEAPERREIYFERSGLKYGPYRDAEHARQHGFMLTEESE